MEIDAEFLHKEVEKDRQEGKPDAGDVVDQYQSWGVTAALKPYQSEGVAWLIRRHNEGVNVILGDEMGLGKTLQAITFVAYLRTQKHSEPVLVLCPLSVTQGWVSEFEKFAPNVRVVSYTGQKEHRKGVRSSLRSDGSGCSFEVVISTYELVMVDSEFLSSIHWGYLIVDEAQRLKNSSSVLFKTLEEKFQISRRLLLTGTPIQNNISELWSLLHFCNPAIFDNLELFVNFFNPGLKDGAEDRLRMLRVLLSAYMLRRTKAALICSNSLTLPPLTEVTIFVQLSPLQRSVYISVLKKDMSKLVGTSTSQAALQNTVVQLRKACSHPYLFDGVEPEPFEEGEHLVQASSKLMVLDLILQKLYNQGHRVLIFAQMTRTLDILQDFLEYRQYSYDRLDGSVRAEERFAAVKKFSHSRRDDELGTNTATNHDDCKPFVFLLTTRAGGVGLNLVAADTVIFFEQDWNPQADKQALQRAHRIGQTHPVLAISLVCQHTIEEIIRRRAEKKLQLTYDVIGPADDEDGPEDTKAVQSSKLQSMIMFSLHRMSADCALDDNGSNSYGEAETLETVEKTVVDALNRRGEVVSDADSGGTSSAGNADLDDNIHTFDGKDYTNVRKQMEGGPEEEDWASSADRAVVASWLCDSEVGASVGKYPTIIKRRRSPTPDGSAERLEQERAEKQKKVEERKQRKWKSMGYVSLAVRNAKELSNRLSVDSDATYLHFVIGDCTKPARDEAYKHAIILHFVDDSGTWGRGGMFTALSRLSQKVPGVYTAAHEAGDLHVGDLHLVPVSGQDGPSTTDDSRSEDQEQAVSVGLAVVQSYDRRRKVPRAAISMSAVETCLKEVCNLAVSSCASVHVPRVGSRSSGLKNEWYVMERLLRKYATSSGVHFYVYYYNHNHQS